MSEELKPAFIEDDPQPPAEEIARLKVELARKLDAAEAEIRSHRSMEPESAMTDELKPRPERGCEHGLALHRARLPTGGWNGPVSYCKCCQSYFGYIDSMSIGTGGAHGKTWTPKDRCAQCGGKYHDWSKSP